MKGLPVNLGLQRFGAVDMRDRLTLTIGMVITLGAFTLGAWLLVFREALEPTELAFVGVTALMGFLLTLSPSFYARSSTRTTSGGAGAGRYASYARTTGEKPRA